MFCCNHISDFRLGIFELTEKIVCKGHGNWLQYQESYRWINFQMCEIFAGDSQNIAIDMFAVFMYFTELKFKGWAWSSFREITYFRLYFLKPGKVSCAFSSINYVTV